MLPYGGFVKETKHARVDVLPGGFVWGNCVKKKTLGIAFVREIWPKLKGVRATGE